MPAAQLALGFVLLFAGGELLLLGSVGLARRLRVSPLLIGATVVAFGTSAPELAVCLKAAWTHHEALAVGNVVGSNIANVLLILGLAGLVAPIRWRTRSVRRDASILVGASVIFTILAASGRISTLAGAGMVLLLLALIAYSYTRERRDGSTTVELLGQEAEEIQPRTPRLAQALLSAAGGLTAVIVGADQLVLGATGMARAAGVSEAAIGLTLVALGTSLPELATSLVAAYRNHAEVALGNVLGSNVFNLLGIAGATALVAPLAVPLEILQFDLWLMLVLMIGLGLLMGIGSSLGRLPALGCLLAYVTWLAAKV